MPFPPASILTVFAAERSLAFWSRVATCYRIQPLSHPAVRQPRSSDKMDLTSSGAVGRASLFRFLLSPSRRPITPKALYGRAAGRPFEHHQTGEPANQQTRQTGLSAVSHHKVASG